MGTFCKVFVAVIFSLFFAGHVHAADPDTNPKQTILNDTTNYIITRSEDKGVISYYRDKRLDKIFDIQKDINKRKAGIPGYRVQLYRGNSQKLSKEEAFRIEAKVYQEYGSDVDVQVIFKTPYWRVQAGNFRLQNEAMKMEADFKRTFPEMADDISVVPAMIAFPELKHKSEK